MVIASVLYAENGGSIPPWRIVRERDDMCHMRVNDVVQEYFPGISNRQIHELLWSATAYPFIDGNEMAQQLSKLRNQIDDLKKRPGFVSGESGDIGIAMSIADAETSMVMKSRDY